MTNGDYNTAPPQEALQSLILDPDLERLEDLLADFNLFDVLSIARAELQHSAFLAWLLNPRASHGLRDYFLRTFLAQAAREAHDRGIGDITPFDVDSWKLSDVEVATERHRIDILILGREDGFVCLIENKIGSGEISGQLRHYLNTVESQYEGLTPVPIFLTPDGDVPETEADAKRYVPFDYGRVADLIDRTLQTRGSTISASVTTFLEQYAGTLRRHVLNDKDNIDELANRIYDNHRAAIDLIIKAKSDRDTLGWGVLESALNQYAPDLKRDSRTKTMLRLYSGSWEDIPLLREGSGWTESGRLLLFEIKHDGGALNLHLYIGPGPQETQKTRQRLKAIADDKRVLGVSMRRPAKLGSKWHYIYRRSILNRQDYKSFDADTVKPKVEQAVCQFYENDYWPIVNAIRKEFDLPAISPK